MSKFVHLHTHSHYSLLDGLGKIDQLLERAKELRMPTLALTDHGVMYGAIEFYTKAKEKGIKPIIGCEIYIAPRSMYEKTPKIDTRPYHLTLLARNKEGYQNLIKITSAAHLEGFYYKPRIDKEFLSKHAGGLIGLSGCFLGEVPRMIAAGNFTGALEVAREYQRIFDGHFYIELQDHPNIEGQKEVKKQLIRLAEESGIPPVATADVHYILPEDKEPHDILLQVQTSQFDEERKLEMKSADLWMKSEEEMLLSFGDLPQALENTLKIAKECDLEIDLGQNLLPYFKVPEGMTPDSYLKKKAYEGLKRRYGQKVSSPIKKRLEYELSVIEKTGFASYFLIVADFVNFAKTKGILVGPGRGSAAGSLVAYCLGITEIDPIKYNLLFERFLNPERISLPDIDLDFADDRRDEVIKYIVDKYGYDHVAQIITFGTMAARAAVRDTGRALGMSYSEVDQVAKLVPPNLPLKESIQKVPELRKIYQEDAKVRRLLDIASRLEGVARHASTHAAGLVISKEPLIESVPIQKAPKGETATITQYSMYDIEKIGLLKIDLLGLSNLSILGKALEIIQTVYGQEIAIDKIPLDDKKTYNLLSKGETIGVFQLESEGMRRYLIELKPSVFEDIISMVALYRPGPLESIPAFIAGKHGRSKVTYLHPKLKSILEKTYGVIVTQDQVLEIARQFAGMSYAEADILRKAVGKKIPKLLKEQKEKFIQGAQKHSKVKREVAEKVWNFIEPFARYGFNRAHAACYALIAYWTAYLKAHYPAAFMAALMTSESNDIEKIAKDVKECERLGIKVLPPSVNESFRSFAVVPETGNIRFALSAIKNVGEGIIRAIVRERKLNGPYRSIDDFARRVDYTQLNRKVLESLIKSGAMDELAPRERLLAGIDQILNYAHKMQKNHQVGQIDLFSSHSLDFLPQLELPSASAISQEQKLAWEKELLGIYVSSHPLEPYQDYLEKKTFGCGNLTLDQVGQRVKVGGIITNLHKVLTKTGQSMLFVTLEDLTGQIEVIVFPRLLEANPALWSKDKIILVSGLVSNNKEEEPKVIAETGQELTLSLIKAKNLPKKVIIKLPARCQVQILQKLQKLLEKHPGEREVFLEVEGKKIHLPYKVDFSEELKKKIKTLINHQNSSS